MNARKRTNPPEPVRGFAELRAADVMQSDLVSVRAGDTLEEVERVVADARVGGVPVLDDDGHMLGVLSTKDLVRCHAEDAERPEDVGFEDVGFEDTVLDAEETEPVAFQRANGTAVCAGDVMTTEVETIGPDTSLVDAARTMVTNGVHRLVVVDHGRLVGIVSTMDLLRPLAGLPTQPR